MKISWWSVKRSSRYYDFRFSVPISGGHLGFWSEPKIDGVGLCPMMVWSCRENFVMIGQTVSDIWRFQCSGAHFRPPSWIFGQTGSALYRRMILTGIRLQSNLVKIAPTAQKLWYFFEIQDGGHRHLGFRHWAISSAICDLVSWNVPCFQIWWKSVRWFKSYSTFSKSRIWLGFQHLEVCWGSF